MFTKLEELLLYQLLLRNCPVDTGALKFSINPTEDATHYILVLGGINLNPKSKKATETYASYVDEKGKHKNWVENTIKEWSKMIS